MNKMRIILIVVLLSALFFGLYLFKHKPKTEENAPVVDLTDNSTTNKTERPNKIKNDKLETVSVLALASSEGRAVLQMPNGKMLIVTVGDKVPDTNAIVLQVLHDKLVLKDTIQNNNENPQIQIVWLYKTENSGDKPVIRRFSDNKPGKNQLIKPNMQ